MTIRKILEGVTKLELTEELEGWQAVAKKELEQELEVQTNVVEYEYYGRLGALPLESTSGKANNEESEWIVFEDYDKAEEAAIAKVKEDLENEPEIFTQSWLQYYIEIGDTDRRIMAGEEADRRVEDMEDEEVTQEAGIDDPEEAREALQEKYYDEMYKALEDPINYFVDEQGIYTIEDLMKQSFIRIDVDRAAQDAIDTDGVAHFLDGYDNEEVELPSGAVAYGTN